MTPKKVVRLDGTCQAERNMKHYSHQSEAFTKQGMRSKIPMDSAFQHFLLDIWIVAKEHVLFKIQNRKYFFGVPLKPLIKEPIIQLV